jgi:hypothetical protein
MLERRSGLHIKLQLFADDLRPSFDRRDNGFAGRGIEWPKSRHVTVLPCLVTATACPATPASLRLLEARVALKSFGGGRSVGNVSCGSWLCENEI